MNYTKSLVALMTAVLAMSGNVTAIAYNDSSSTATMQETSSKGSFAWKVVSPKKARLCDADINSFRQAVQKKIDEHIIAGAVTAIVKDNKLVFYEAQGQADPTMGKAMEKDAIFTMMSSSKVVLGISALQLMEQGKISLDDPVKKYIPEFSDMKVFVSPNETVAADKDITLRHLLTHTAGLMSVTNFGFMRNKVEQNDGDSLKDVVPRLSQVTLDFQPGTQWSYSPLHGLDIMARIVEIVSGEPYDQYVHSHIFEPLGMKETWFTVPESERSRVVPLLKWENGKWTKQTKLMGEYGETQATYFSASGGLLSTAHDYTCLEVALLNGGILNGNRILKPESVRLMGTNLVDDKYSKFMPIVSDGYGFGITVRVAVDTDKCHGQGEGAFGWNGAYGTDSWVDPIQGIAAASLISDANGTRDVSNALSEAIHAALENVKR